MKLHLITIGKKMPSWINEGFHEYAKRLSHDCTLNLIELDMPKRTKNSSIDKLIAEEGKQMLAAIPHNTYVIALDEHGKCWNTQELAQQLTHWKMLGKDIALLIGGPDGLAKDCFARADQQWSLSPLTLPHPLVRVILAEQLYRAASILVGHPYHRS